MSAAQISTPRTVPTNQAESSALTRELEVVLPSVLATSAQQDLPAITSGVEAGNYGALGSAESIGGAVVGIAAALGVVGAAPLARALLKRGLDRVRLPDWLRPRIDSAAKPIVLSLTAFYDQRARLVKEVEAGQPVILTRHGTAIAAVVPLERGAYEEAALQKFLDASDGGPVDELTSEGELVRGLRVPEPRRPPETEQVFPVGERVPEQQRRVADLT